MSASERFTLSDRLDALPDDARLVLMAQNPADNYHWSTGVAKITAGEFRRAVRHLREIDEAIGRIAKAEGQS